VKKVDYNTINEIATSPSVWAVLCILLTAAVLKIMHRKNEEREGVIIKLYEDYRTESKEREQSLLDHLERSNKSQAETSETLKQIRSSLSSLENRMDRVEKHYSERG
jgi:predicted nuclease with TOPRIM domain